jgi:hypothetical protein
MNGIIALDSRTGQLLYRQAYAKNFGLPATHRPVERDGERQLDDLKLAAMLFALFINSRAVIIPGSRAATPCESAGDKPSETYTPGLQLYEVGHTVLHFSHDEGSHVLCVASIESVLGPEIGRFCACRILQDFVQEYCPMGAPATSISKRIRPPKSFLHGIFQEMPGRIVELLLLRIEPGLRPDWIFCWMSEAFMAQVDWDDFLESERDSSDGDSATRADLVRALPIPFTPVKCGGSGAGYTPVKHLPEASMSTYGYVGTPLKPRGGTRRKDIPKVGFRTAKNRWWSSAAKPEHSLTSLGPLQYLYIDEKERSNSDATATVPPTRQTLAALVGLVHKAGKVLSSVGDVRPDKSITKRVLREFVIM